MKSVLLTQSRFGMRFWAILLTAGLFPFLLLGKSSRTNADCRFCGTEWVGDTDGWLLIQRDRVDADAGICDECACDTSISDELAQRRARYFSSCRGLHPRCEARVGGVYMNRVGEDFRVLIESTANPIRQVNAEAFDFAWEPGLDLSIRRLAWDDDQFEFRFLGVRGFSADQRVDTGGSEVRINSDPVFFIPDVDSINATYDSDLYGFELNWHCVTYCPFNYVAGFRYLALDESLRVELNSDPGSYLCRTETRNDLYGMQIGITNSPEMPIFGWSCLSWFAKVGIFGNDATQSTVLDTNVLGQIVNSSPAVASVVWDFGLGLDLPISDRFSIQGGYGALILDRVTVASDQLSQIDFINATADETRGTVMFHGGNLALVLRH